MSARKAATGLLVLAAASLLLFAAPATAARHLRQEDAPQGEPVTTSHATRWCISLDQASPNAITLQPTSWDVSDWAAPPDNTPAAWLSNAR
jgi:hypothetical protein